MFAVVFLSVGDDSWRVADGVTFLHFCSTVYILVFLQFTVAF